MPIPQKVMLQKEIRQCITQAYPPPLNSTTSTNTTTGVVPPAG
jgi:hypothetical protein